ncbi:MAG: zinc metallopeptidase [Gammaproteobacteria bacterium]|nr:zinc metallopeptidase [Gammaproteobacteria bacterium]
MRWRIGRRSTNIEDRRGRGPARLPRGAKLGGGAGILVLLAVLFLGQDLGQILSMLGAAPGPEVSTPQVPTRTPGQQPDAAADFVSVVLADTEDTWESLFASQGERYNPPKMVLYEGMVQSACGFNSAAAGPFYCPGDDKVYLDLGFLRELQRMGASGDFAVAYVIAHEIGHHVQNLVGTSKKVRELQSRVGRGDANALSVLAELQADCYAGVWAYHAHQQRNILEQGDVEEGINAAAAVGDDRLMKMAGRGVHPESFTHGSSKQRMHWFQTGLQSGRLDTCNTFAQASR